MRRLGIAFGVAAALTFFVGPLAWQVLTSLWPEAELTRAWPSHLSGAAYARVLWGAQPFWRMMWNSLVVATATTLLTLTVGAAAAFALARLALPGRRLMLGGVLALSMYPPIATVSPLYLLLRAVGLRDQLAGLVLPYTAFALPLGIWVLHGFFRQLPDDLYRAARVDGCSPLQALWRVFLPLAAPALATTAILVFIFSWNEFLYAVTLMSSQARRTVPVGIALLSSEHVEPWAEIAAASVVSTLPLVLVTVAFQRRIAAGLTGGAVKG